MNAEDLEALINEVHAPEGGGWTSKLIDAARTLLRERDAIALVLADAVDWMRYNPPTTGWGTLDRGADADRKEITARAIALIDPPADDASGRARGGA